MKRQTIKRNLVWGAVLSVAAFGLSQSLKHGPDIMADTGLAWVVVALFGVVTFSAFVFGFLLGVFPILATLIYRHVLTEKDRRGRYVLLTISLIEEHC